MKKGKEFFTTFLTCLMAIVSFSISSCGTNSSSLPNQMDLYIGHDWKSDISIGIESNKTFNEVEDNCQKYINGFNSISGDNDFVKYQSLTKNSEDSYSLSAKLRRIDKIKGVGEFDISSLSNFSVIDSDRYNLVKRLVNGTWSYKSSASFEGERGQISIDRSRPNKISSLTFKDINGNNPGDIEEFLEKKGLNAESNTKLFAFRFIALDEAIGNIEKITISLPGNIIYYAGKDMEIINSSTFSISTSYVTCSIIRQNSESIIEKDCLCAYGFVILDQNMSPVSLGFIIAGAIVLFGLILSFFIYFYLRGKKYYKRINGYGNE